VLGVIDVDPASCSMAQTSVQATTYYTKECSGLEVPWPGRVYLNPPFLQPWLREFIQKLLQEVTAGRTTEAILLTPGFTTEDYWQDAVQGAQRLCFPRARVRFRTPQGKIIQPWQSNTLFYYGPHLQRFTAVFQDAVGVVVCGGAPNQPFRLTVAK
jgi:hypothetical protein